MNDIVCHLGSTLKYRNTQEYRPLPKITCPEFNIKFEGDGRLVDTMVKALHENNCQIDRYLAIYRGDTLVFEKVDLKSWVFPINKQPEWLKNSRKRKES